MDDEPAKTPRNNGRIFKTCKWGMIQGGTKTVLGQISSSAKRPASTEWS